MAEAEAAADAAAPPTQSESARQTFFTTIDAEPAPKQSRKQAATKPSFRTLSSTNAGTRISEHHQDLQTLANTLDQRMEALLREHEKDFFLAYKTHMYDVQKTIKTLRMKADIEESKTREDTKIKALEGELDWFMTEALRLDELCKGYKKEVDKWKAKADALDEDRRFLEDQIKGAKRQNKILRAAAERARSSAYSALLATRARSEEHGGGGGYPSGETTLALPSSLSEAALPRPSSADRPAAGSGARRVIEARSRTPDAHEALAPALPASPSANIVALGGRAQSLGALPRPNVDSTDALLPSGGRGLLGNETEERYVEAINHLKESIIRAQQNVRMLQATRATQYSQKSELEEFFLKCVHEARNELNRKRHLTMHKDKSDKERALEAMLNNEDVLVCLYERLFPHKTGIARSLGGPQGGEEAQVVSRLPLEDGARRYR